MKLIDTHCHINTMVKKEFDIPLPNNFVELATPIVKTAAQADVTTIINVGTSLPESKNCIELAKAFDNCFATVGIHPNDLKDTWQSYISELENLLGNKKVVGIGEIGFDFHYPGYNKERQHEAFEAQVSIALHHNLPIVIHTRDAGQTVLDALEKFQGDPRGIIHCFSENLAFAERAIGLGFVLGIGGPLTYPKNETLREVFKTVPLEKIVLETDAPFLPPQKIRGKQNSPAQVRNIAQFLAELRGITLEEVAQATTQTAEKLFWPN
jgi:TatD DNase family protein